MQSQNTTNEKTEQENQFEAFDGELVHPSLDIKNGVLVLGFRYRSKQTEEKDIFIVSIKSEIIVTEKDSFTFEKRRYYLDKRVRSLARIEEKWSVSALKCFQKEYAEIKPMVTPKEIFEKLIALAKKYVELEKEIDYHILTAWILGTYFYPAFSAYPFLHIKAPKHSGKSQCLNFLAQLCFNAVKARPSLPALCDTVDALRGTYLIDQADSLKRRGSEELLDVLADSYKKDGGKRRIINFDKRGSRHILEFETYSPKAFASIDELPEDLRDRCLVIQLIRSQKNFADPDNENENWREIRGQIYRIQIINHDFINSDYVVKKIEYRKNLEILGRSLELWLPFEVILRCFGAEEYVTEAKKRFLAQYGYSEYEPAELEEAVVRAILNQLKEKTEAILTPKEISEFVDNDLFHPSDSPKQRAAKVGWAIKKFNLSSEKKSRTKDGVRYLFEKAKVEGLYRCYFEKSAELTPLTVTASEEINTGQTAV